MRKRWAVRAAALLGAAAVSAGVLVAVASPAQAASLGTITVSQSSGTVNDLPMFASGTTSAPCPQGFGTNAELRIGRPGGPYNNLMPALRAGGYDTAPVEVGATRSFATALGGTLPEEGEWWIVVQCYSLTLGGHPDEFRTPVFVTGTTWSTTPDTADPTTTSLAVTPPSPVEPGTEVTLTADVEPDTAAGTVDFKRGSLVIGSAPVSGAAATASLTTTSLPIGTHSITATFTPADPAELQTSSSPARSYTIAGDLPPGTGQQEIVAEILPGAFALEVEGDVQLAGGSVGGTASGDLPEAEVTDLRGGNAGWTLTGQLVDFNTEPATTAIPAANLSWDPSASKTSGSGTVTEGAGADLGAARTLCSASASISSGVFSCGAGLALSVPENTAPGVYRATLTLTLA